jgi:hypothetical protein
LPPPTPTPRWRRRSDIALDVAADQIYGALFFRLLLGHAPVDAGFVRTLLAQALHGLVRG